jgi:hypothetical protein
MRGIGSPHALGVRVSKFYEDSPTTVRKRCHVPKDATSQCKNTCVLCYCGGGLNANKKNSREIAQRRGWLELLKPPRIRWPRIVSGVVNGASHGQVRRDL